MPLSSLADVYVGAPRTKPLQPREVSSEFHPFLGFAEQHKGIAGRLVILRTCRSCGKQDWVFVGDIRAKLSRGGYKCHCRQCGPHHRDTKGEKSPLWRGGKYKTGDGYVRVYAPDHPLAVYGRVLEHRLVMEQSLGRFLSRQEQVHHKNGVKDDNRLENLELICPSNHALRTAFCRDCELKKEIRLLRWQVNELQKIVQGRLGEGLCP